MRFIKGRLSVLFFYTSLIVLGGCTPNENASFRFITVKTEESTSIVPLKFMAQVYPADSGKFVSFTAERGDLLSVDKSVGFIVRDDLPDTLILSWNDYSLKVNGELHSIEIVKGKQLPSELEKLGEADILKVKALCFSGRIDDAYKPFLQNFAHYNPHVDLFMDSDGDDAGDKDFHWLAQYFKPRSLSISGTADAINYLTKDSFTDLEFLLLFPQKNGFSGRIPKLPSLKSLFVFMDDRLKTPINKDFFSENPQIETLSIYGDSAAAPGLPPWSGLSRLRELNMITKFTPYSLSRYHPELKSLSVLIADPDSTNTEFKNLTEGLDKLKSLSIGIPAHQELAPYIRPLRALERLEIYNDDKSYRHYDSLSLLPHLKYLLISGKLGQDSALFNLKGLKFLSVPEEYLEDTLRANALKRALPNAVISPNSGVCLGSGWLLVLLPLIGIWYFFRQRQPKKISTS